VTIRSLLFLSAAIPAFVPVAVLAQTDSGTSNEIIVRALALETSVNEAETPVIVLTGDDLHHRAQATLGETLAGEPGVSFDNFGGGASRPVIRGQTSPRVEVLSDGSAIQDASEISPDHAIVAEPLLLRGIEVLRGPATLRFGGGAIGGAVNLLDEKVPTSVPENGLTGVLEGRLGTADDERSLVGGATLGVGSFALRVEGVDRSSKDYRVPDEFGEDMVHGSYNDTSTYTFGGSWVGADGYFGVAYTNHISTYGLPGHEHEYEGCHPHGSSLHCGSHEEEEGDEHDHDHDHEHEEVPFVDLRSERMDVRGEYGDLIPGIENVAFRYAHTKYEHDEVEEDVIATTFRNKSHDARLELTHAAIGPFRGVLGGQFSHSDFSAEGEEAFLAPTKTQNTAVFLLESAQFGPVRLDLAARQEWQRVEAELTGPYSVIEHSPFSISAGAVWDVASGYSVALSLARSQRAPNQQELFANGIHLATNTFEIGMLSRLPAGQAATAEEETSNSANLTLRKTNGPTTFTLGLFHQDFDNYIYAETLDQFEDFRLIRYTGAEATFTGVDGEIRHQFTPGLAASVFGDYVRAELKDGLGNVPRIPPARLGATIEAEWDRVSLDAQYFHAFQQDDIADFETETGGYDMLNATIAYSMDLGNERSVELFARGSNLFDELAFNHASFIKDASPIRGRNVVFGLRTSF
jgi:iron complex outermembrane receptor protein